MALKKDQQQNIYTNTIGVNRGAGFTSAANQLSDTARTFDNIMDRISSTELKRLKKEGLIRGQKVAETIPYVEDSVEIDVGGTKQNITIYKAPEVPDYLKGQTARDTYETVFYDRLKRDNLNQLDSIVTSAMESSISSGSSPEAFELQVDGISKAILDEYDKDYRSVLDVEFQLLKDRKAIRVAESYNRKLNQMNQDSLADKEEEFNTRIIIDSSQNKKTDQNELDIVNAYIDQTNSTDVQKNILKQKIKKRAETTFKFFNKYNKNIRPKSGIANYTQARDTSKLVALLEDPGLAQVTLNGGQVVTQESIESMLGPNRQFILNNLKKIKTTYGTKIDSNNKENIYAMSLQSAFEQRDDGSVNINTPFMALSDTKKLDTKVAQSIFDSNYTRYAKKNGIDSTDLIIKDRIQLETTGTLGPDRMNFIKNDIRSGNINKQSLSTISSIGDYITARGLVGESGVVGGLDNKELTELVLMNEIYRQENFDADKTIETYSAYKRKEKVNNLDIILKDIKKGKQATDGYLRRKIINVFETKSKIKTMDAQLISQTLSRVKYMLINGVRIESDNELDPLIQKALGINYTTRPIDNYQFGTSRITTSATANVVSTNGIHNIVIHPFEHYFGVGELDVEMKIYEPSDMTDDNRLRQSFQMGVDDIMRPTSARKDISIYNTYFKKLLKGSIIDDAIQSKLQTGKLGDDIFSNERIMVSPLNSGYSRPGEPPNYRFVYINDDGDAMDILTPAGDPVIIYANDLNQIKMKHIMNLEDEELENG
jgi:hypothetical protein